MEAFSRVCLELDGVRGGGCYPAQEGDQEDCRGESHVERGLSIASLLIRIPDAGIARNEGKRRGVVLSRD